MRIRALVAAATLAVLSVVVVGGAATAQEEPPHEETESRATHAGEECIEILEKGGKATECHDAPSPILPEPKEIIWGAISFLVLLFAMTKFAYPAIKKSMDARTEKIRTNLNDAERVKTEADTVLEDYKRQMAEARNESSRIIEEARQTADQLRRDLMQRAEAEVAELRQRTREDIAAAQQRATADLQGRVGELAIELAGKVVEANLDREANMRLIETYIAQVGSTS
ncbi:MAG: F0F1 ATP synthase subunit B [Acidimicrobiales bacterium]